MASDWVCPRCGTECPTRYRCPSCSGAVALMMDQTAALARAATLEARLRELEAEMREARRLDDARAEAAYGYDASNDLADEAHAAAAAAHARWARRVAALLTEHGGES